MSEQMRMALSEAFDLIEAERLDEARAILKPMLTTHADNPDVWWLYAHAVTDADTARTALYTVLRLDPSYPDANNLVKELEQQATVTRPGLAVTESEPSFLTDLPPTLPDLPELDNEDDFTDVDLGLEGDEDEAPSDEPASQRRLLLLAALGVIVILAIVAVALLTSRPGGPAAPTPTVEMVAGQPSATPLVLVPEQTASPEATADATEVIETEAAVERTPEAAETPTTEAEVTADATEITETEAAVERTLEAEPSETPIISNSTAEATAASLAVEPSPTTEIISPTTSAGESPTESLAIISEALASFNMADSGVQIETTELGSTLVANICTAAGLELRAALPSVMDVLARQSLPADAEAVGARMINCDDNTTLLLIAVPVSGVVGYADGSLSEEDFQALWKSL